MRKVLAFLIIAGLLFTASPAFADSPSEAARQGSVTPDCPVPPIITLTGVLTKVLHQDCHDHDCYPCYEYFVTPTTGGTAKRVEFGPKWYITTTKVKDYDKNNSLQTIAQELDGLIALGTAVPFRVKLCKDNSYEVFTINGEFYRKDSGPPPWSGGPKGKGKGK